MRTSDLTDITEARPGDRVIAIDGHPVAARTVRTVLAPDMVITSLPDDVDRSSIIWRSSRAARSPSSGPSAAATSPGSPPPARGGRPAASRTSAAPCTGRPSTATRRSPWRPAPAPVSG